MAGRAASIKFPKVAPGSNYRSFLKAIVDKHSSNRRAFALTDQSTVLEEFEKQLEIAYPHDESLVRKRMEEACGDGECTSGLAMLTSCTGSLSRRSRGVEALAKVALLPGEEQRRRGRDDCPRTAQSRASAWCQVRRLRQADVRRLCRQSEAEERGLCLYQREHGSSIHAGSKAGEKEGLEGQHCTV